MAAKKMVHDPIAELERMERFFNGEEAGVKPRDVLRKRGIPMPPAEDLDDAILPVALWTVIEGMASLGMYLECTNHLNDRQLYNYLMTALEEETVLSDDALAGWHLSPIGGCSEEDNEVWLRYYADDEDRRLWSLDTEEPLPPRALPVSDRDARLPGHEEELQTSH